MSFQQTALDVVYFSCGGAACDRRRFNEMRTGPIKSPLFQSAITLVLADQWWDFVLTAAVDDIEKVVAADIV